jgi:hypothetical protein
VKKRSNLEKLDAYIATYESDTFSASGANLKADEAKRIVDHLIGTIIPKIDGVQLSALLDVVRFTDD